MDLRTYLRILRSHWLGIIIVTAVGVAAAAGWAFLQPKVYSADATGYVTANAQNDGSSQTSDALLANNLAIAKVVSYVDVGSWRSVAEQAIQQLSLTTSPEDLVKKVKVSNTTGTVTIRVDASGSTPEEARDLAEAWIQGMATEIDALESNDGQVVAAVRLVPADTARLPDGPTSPNVRLAVGIGGVIGLVLGTVYAIARYTLDRRVRSADAVERETGAAVVGTIPIEKTFSSGNRLVPAGEHQNASSVKLFAVAEALRDLRTNIQFMDVDNPPRVIVVTSPVPGDGKSTISANLALVIAASGQPVILIDGDLRRPVIASVFNLVEGAGITDVLAGRASLDDVAQQYGGLPNLRVVAAGKVPPNPSEVLGSERMRDLLNQLSQDAVVIVDAPPLLAVTDAAVLAHSADGAIIVASAGKTTIEMLKKALQHLERAGSRPLGIVLNRVPKRGGGYYDYQYSGVYYGVSVSSGSDGVREQQGGSAPASSNGPRRSRRVRA